MVWNRTITRFIADDKIYYQRVSREMQLASDNSWARRRLKHLSRRLWWIMLYTLEQRVEVSHEISRADRCLFGLSSWLNTRSSTATRLTRSTAAWLSDKLLYPSCGFSLAVVDAFKFPTLVGKFLQQPSCTIPLWQIDFLNQNPIFLRNFYNFV